LNAVQCDTSRKNSKREARGTLRVQGMCGGFVFLVVGGGFGVFLSNSDPTFLALKKVRRILANRYDDEGKSSASGKETWDYGKKEKRGGAPEWEAR